MLRLVEEEADFSRFDELFSQVLKILPSQVENVQEMFEELSAMDRTRKKSVIFNPGGLFLLQSLQLLFFLTPFFSPLVNVFFQLIIQLALLGFIFGRSHDV